MASGFNLLFRYSSGEAEESNETHPPTRPTSGSQSVRSEGTATSSQGICGFIFVMDTLTFSCFFIRGI